jgi:hypothetical protein
MINVSPGVAQAPCQRDYTRNVIPGLKVPLDAAGAGRISGNEKAHEN